MDTSGRTIVNEAPKGIARRLRSNEEKRRIVEETLLPGASVSRVARRHDVNANQVFHWRQRYRGGHLGENPSGKLLPVTVTEHSWSECEPAGGRPSFSAGSLEIKLAKGTVRIAGNVDVVVLRTAIECLLG